MRFTLKSLDHYHITVKCRVSAHKDCDINVKLNYKIPVVSNNLKICDSRFIMQELDKFNLKINVILNELEKCIFLNINYKLRFIDSFQLLRNLLDSLVKNLLWF